MVFGVLKDIKEGEYRVMCTPLEVAAIIASGHDVLVESDAGKAAGFPNEAYEKAGAKIIGTAEEMWDRCDMVAKVKEYMPEEFPFMRENQLILGCLHPASHPEEVEALLQSKCISFTAEDMHRYGSPNCEAAGKQGALFGLESLLTINGGKGKFVGGFAGAPGINALILGGGIVGSAALSVLHALGANVTVMDINYGLLMKLGYEYKQKINTMFCTKEAIASVIGNMDLIINAVRWPKHRKDFLIDKEMLKMMEAGSVIVDISNDDPGAIESSRETHHDNPRYVVNGVVHYCVSNIPGAVAHSTSVSYAVEMLPLILSILNDGVAKACEKDGYVRRGLTTYKGYLTHEETSGILNLPWVKPEVVLQLDKEKLDPAPQPTSTKSDHYYPEFK